MFADYLSDSPYGTRRGWITLASFGLQAIAVGALLLLPLLYTQALPQLQFMVALVAPSGPAAPPPTQSHATTTSASNLLPNLRIMGISSIPRTIPVVVDEVAPPRSGPSIFTVPGGTVDGSTDNPVMSAITRAPAGFVPALRPIPTAHPPRVSRMMEGNLIHRVQPDYPLPAKSARIQGEVVLAAIIGKDGSIQNLHVVKGHPILVKAALDAVQQWRYRPYLLNGDPVEVETQVTVNFVLSGG